MRGKVNISLTESQRQKERFCVDLVPWLSNHNVKSIRQAKRLIKKHHGEPYSRDLNEFLHTTAGARYAKDYFYMIRKSKKRN